MLACYCPGAEGELLEARTDQQFEATSCEAKHHQQFEVRLKTGDFFLFLSPAVQLMASALFGAQQEIKDVVLSRAFRIKDGY